MTSDEISEPCFRYRVVFHGTVQGIGFRYTTRGLANKFPVVGYVKNLPDGTVELETEGALEAVRFFLDDVKEFFSGYIERFDEISLPALKSEDSFSIRL